MARAAKIVVTNQTINMLCSCASFAALYKTSSWSKSARLPDLSHWKSDPLIEDVRKDISFVGDKACLRTALHPDVGMAALKLDVGQNGHDSLVDMASTASHNLPGSDAEDTARESDVPAPPYSTWPTAGQEEAAQQAAQQNSGACYDFRINLDERNHSAAASSSSSSSSPDSAVVTLPALSTVLSRKRRLRGEIQSSCQRRRYHKSPSASSRSFGVCLSQAPRIAPEAFIGRTTELQQLQDWLSPKTNANRQRIVSIVGMGGMGKTQLSLAHVDACADDYSSVFWVNAKDETSLRQSMAQLNAVINDESAAAATQSADDEQLKVDKVRRWLSNSGNDQWLFIFDNYDDPCLPGIRSPTGYDIRSFFPTRSQGSIIITSRSTRLAFSKKLKIQKTKDVNSSVAILSQRSGRDLSHDGDAPNLARRLDGLPLALATAGTYLGRAGISCGEYLGLYNSAWIDLVGADTEELLEYEARTISSTWTISLDQVRSQDGDAAELLTFLAYLNNRDVWYDLIKAGAHKDVPWICRVVESKIRFQRAMLKLQDYNLVNVVASSYEVHPCLHDWLIEGLNSPLSYQYFITALTCVGSSIDDISSPHYWVTSRRLLEHVEHLESHRFHELWERYAFEEEVLHVIDRIGGLLQDWNRLAKAEQMYDRALAGREKTLGPDHTSTLSTVHNLGILYRDQGKLDAAEQIYDRALVGCEKTLGPDHTSTLSTVHALGVLYRDQGKLDAAEQMYDRALVGYEKTLGPDHTSTLDTVHNLGNLYGDQGKLDAAEQMYLRALRGYEKVVGKDHPRAQIIARNLQGLHAHQ